MRYGKKGECAWNETENYSFNYTVVYNKDITYKISKPNRNKVYMLLSDPTLQQQKRKLFYVLLTYFPPKGSSEKK